MLQKSDFRYVSRHYEDGWKSVKLEIVQKLVISRSSYGKQKCDDLPEHTSSSPPFTRRETCTHSSS